MRVLIDIQAAIAQRAGVGRYVKSLVEHLGAFSDKDEVCLFYFDFQRKGTPFAATSVRQKAIRWCPGRIVQKAWKTIYWPPFNWFAGAADVYHFPNFIRPPLTEGKTVVTIHDVSFLRFPETTEARNLRYLTAQIKNTAEKADAIVTDSEFVAREIQELLSVPREKIFPIHLGISEHMTQPDESEAQAILRKLGVKKPYLLMVGTIEPRKNIPFLIRAFERMKEFNGQLVLAGMFGWKYEPIRDCIDRSSRHSDILHLNYVEEEDLPTLYKGAELFVFPSLYEGFGFTPLEAMACGTPVLSSPAGSLREVLGEGAELLDPDDAEQWASCAQTLIGDSARRAELIKRGQLQAEKFSWRKTAQKTWEVYRMVNS